ncbi:hypothetical protein CFIMG_007507RA00001 [Ceratocystis fimbriata CBS 114723]|uniref:Uncharacterized protein n=1 Tax=Ceratocystis fimbriata CBS 114723 TaxID=1035309 RepID=A0A2C5WWR3_9PEZI|nr:hypothetical protein CFIMG_007507RA00001 [Ceratocystis fimbriata CBS 114723]
MTWEEVWKSEWKEKLDGKGKMVSKIDWGSEEYQAAIFSGLLGLDEQWEASALMGIDTQVADWMSANKGSNDSPSPTHEVRNVEVRNVEVRIVEVRIVEVRNVKVL